MDQNLSRKWQKIVEKFKLSGLSKSEFCRSQNLSFHQFNYWANKFKDHSSSTDALSDFIPLQPKGEIRIKLNSGPELTFSSEIDPVWVSRLISELGARQ